MPLPDGSLREVPLPMHVPPVKIRSVEPKARPPPSPDLPAEEKPPSDLLRAVSLQPKEVRKPYWDTNQVLAWRHFRLPTPVYVRVDCSGAYHSYPELGGPFPDLDAIESALHDYARGNITDTETENERLVREFLEWADGTSMVATRAETAERKTDNVQRLVKALLDKKNDDEHFKYELKDIVHWQAICEGPCAWYYHLNITVKTKGADDDAGSANLFFAEVTLDMNDTPGVFLSSFCRIDPNSKDEVPCHGCMNNGSIEIKHPTSFVGGHVNTYVPHGFGPCNDNQCRDAQNKVDKDEEEKLRKEEEERIRESFDYLEDVEFEEKLRKEAAEVSALHYIIQEDEEMACKD